MGCIVDCENNIISLQSFSVDTNAFLAELLQQRRILPQKKHCFIQYFGLSVFVNQTTRCNTYYQNNVYYNKMDGAAALRCIFSRFLPLQPIPPYWNLLGGNEKFFIVRTWTHLRHISMSTFLVDRLLPHKKNLYRETSKAVLLCVNFGDSHTHKKTHMIPINCPEIMLLHL